MKVSFNNIKNAATSTTLDGELIATILMLRIPKPDLYVLTLKTDIGCADVLFNIAVSQLAATQLMEVLDSVGIAGDFEPTELKGKQFLGLFRSRGDFTNIVAAAPLGVPGAGDVDPDDITF